MGSLATIAGKQPYLLHDLENLRLNLWFEIPGYC